MAIYSHKEGAYLLEGRGREFKEGERKQTVARIYITQSRRSEVIEEEINRMVENGDMSLVEALKEIDITSVILMKKGKDAVNVGQVMPVGGNIEQGETIDEAATREMLEETHLRPTQISQIGKMNYVIDHPKKGDINNDAHFFHAHIPPTDLPYPLNPEEDKAKEFPQLSIEEVTRLFHFNILAKDEERKKLFGDERITASSVILLDSLQTGKNKVIEEKQGQAKLKKTQESKAEQIKNRLLEKLQEDEVAKKKMMTGFIIDLMTKYLPDAGDWRQRIDETTNLVDTQKVLFDLLDTFNANDNISEAEIHQVFLTSIDLSNFEEEVRGSHAGRSKKEAVMRFVFTLLETRYRFDKYLEIAEDNPLLKDFSRNLREFSGLIAQRNGGITKDEFGFGSEIFGNFDSLKKINDKGVEEAFYEAFLNLENNEQNQEYVKVLKNRVVDFLEDTINQGIEPLAGPGFDIKKIDQIAKVKEMGIADLCRVAFPSPGEAVWKKLGHRAVSDDKVQRREFRKRAAFEARRQLVLMHLFKDAGDYYDGYSANETQVNEKVWDKFEEFKSRQINGDNLLECELNLGDGKKYMAHQEISKKSLSSFFRKLFVRGMDDHKKVFDLLRRSVLIEELKEGDKESATGREKRKMYVQKSNNSKTGFTKALENEEGKYIVIDEQREVWDLYDKIANLSGVRIISFKPTPSQSKGVKMQSAGIGGGGKVRFAKFYVEVTKNDGEKAHEEVHVYTPNREKSAREWYKEKKKDDDRYVLSRLFDTRTLRSFIDLMFPTQIYGPPLKDVHKTYIGKGKNN